MKAPSEATKITKDGKEIAVIDHQFSDGTLPEVVILAKTIGDEENGIPEKKILSPFQVTNLGWEFN